MQSSKSESASKIEAERKQLDPDFSPGKYDVICSRGKFAALHAGNVRFRKLIQQQKPDYAKATNKLEKSIIVSKIVDSVREFTPNGGFVKKFEDGRWYEVGDSVAREKIGQSLRDQLYSKYKSSTRAKRGRRQELRAQRKMQQQELEQEREESQQEHEEVVKETKIEESMQEKRESFFFPPASLEPLSLREYSSQILVDFVQSFNIV